MKIIALLITLIITSCSTQEESETEIPFKLVDAYTTKEKDVEERSYAFTKETEIFLKSERFSRLVEIDRNKDGVFEEYIQEFSKNGETILHLTKMAQEGFSVYPFRPVSIALTDLPGIDETLLIFMDFVDNSFLVFQKEKNGTFSPAKPSVAKKVYEQHMKMIIATSEWFKTIQ